MLNYTDDNTLYSTRKKLINALYDLERDYDILLTWFKKKFLKANPGKYHLRLSTEENNALKERGSSL